MLDIRYSKQFLRDCKKHRWIDPRTGVPIPKLDSAISKLAHHEHLPASLRDHALNNCKQYKNCRELHISPDMLLIYKIEDGALELICIRVGSHYDLFGSSILANKKQNPAQMVNTIGRSIYKSTDSAFKAEKTSFHYEVFFEVLYEVPPWVREAYNLDESYADLNTMVVSIDLTSYDDKVRANVIEQDPNNKTLGHKTFPVDKYRDTKDMREAIISFMYKSIAKNYQDYDFIY